VIGVGRWGCQVLVNLWPRLRLQDQQRGRLIHDAPRLRELVSFVLVLPTTSGEIVVARPDPEQWDDVGFVRRLHLALTDDGAHPEPDSLYRALLPTLEIIERYSALQPVPRLTDPPRAPRRTIFESALQHDLALGGDLSWIMATARQDASAPVEEVTELEVYVIASLTEDLASTLVWPLSWIVRDQLGLEATAELIALLSIGTYAPPPQRLYEEATVFAALSELRIFTDVTLMDGKPGWLPPRWNARVGKPAYDRVYLVDNEKLSGALASCETEVTQMAANALEAFLLAGASQLIRDRLAPDTILLHQHGPLSSLGAASIYFPLEEMRQRYLQELRLVLLQNEFLGDLTPEQEAASDERAQILIRGMLQHTEIRSYLLEGSPLAYTSGESRPSWPVAIVPPVSGAVPSLIAPIGARLDAIDAAFASALNHDVPEWVADIATRLGLPKEGIKEEGVDLRRALRQAAQNRPALAQAAMADELAAEMDRTIADFVCANNRGLQQAIRYAKSIVEQLQEMRVKVAGEIRRRRDRGEMRQDVRALQRRRAAVERLAGSEPRPTVVYTGLAILALAIIAVLWNALSIANLTEYLRYMGVVAVAILLLGPVFSLWWRWRTAHAEESYVEYRQEALDRLVHTLLLDAEYMLLEQLHSVARQRAELLEHTQELLIQERDQLAEALAGPLAVPEPAIRTPLIDMSIYDRMYGNVPARLQDVGPIVGRMEDAKEQVVATLVRSINAARAEEEGASPQSLAEISADGRGYNSPYELISLSIERYVALQDMGAPPADLSAEDLLTSENPLLSADVLVNDLYMKAKPFIHLDETVLMPGAPIPVDFLIVGDAYHSKLRRASGPRGKLNLLSSGDPFSIAVLRTIHGLNAQSVNRLAVCAQAYIRLHPNDRKLLALHEDFPPLVLLPDGVPVDSSAPLRPMFTPAKDEKREDGDG